jgi:hypothetical protein
MVPPPSVDRVSWITHTENNGIAVDGERSNVVFFNASVLPSNIVFYGKTIDGQMVDIDVFHKEIRFSKGTTAPICKFKVHSTKPLISVGIIAKFFKRKPYYCEHEECDIATSKDIDDCDTDDEEFY